MIFWTVSIYGNILFGNYGYFLVFIANNFWEINFFLSTQKYWLFPAYCAFFQYIIYLSRISIIEFLFSIFY